MTALLEKEWCGSVYANPPSDRVKPLSNDREISKEELALVCSTLPTLPVRPVLVEHDPSKQVGLITSMYQVPESGTTYARFKLYDNEAGHNTKKAIEAGQLRGLSLGTDWERRPGQPTRLVRLRELSVCTEGMRPDTGIVNASKEAQQQHEFVPLAPLMNPPATVPVSEPMQQQHQAFTGSVNASAQQAATPPQQQQTQLVPNMPYQSQIPQSMTTAPTTMSWGQFASDPMAHFKGMAQNPQMQYPAPYLHHMPLPPGLQPPQQPQQQQPQQQPQQPQQQQQQQPYYAPNPYGLMPPPYMQQPQYPMYQQPQQPQQPQQQQAQQQPQQQQQPAPAVAAPPGMARKNKRTASQAVVDTAADEEETSESSSGAADIEDGKSETDESADEKTSVKPKVKRQETQKDDKIVPMPQTEQELEKAIQHIATAPGMSKQAKAETIRAIAASHRQVKEMYEQNARTAEQALEALEGRMKAHNLASADNNALLRRWRNEIRDPGKFKTVMEEMRSVSSMLPDHSSSSSSSSSSSAAGSASSLDVNSLSQPADALQAAMQEWRSMFNTNSAAQQGVPPAAPAMAGSVNASKSAQQQHQPDFPLPRHSGNPHGIKLVNGQTYVPIYTRPEEPNLFSQRIRVKDQWGTIEFETPGSK